MNISGHTNQIKYLRRLFSSERIPQTILFSGLDGIGKKIIAETMLTSLFCTEENKPCGKCQECSRIKNRTHSDFIIISPDENGKIPIGDKDKKEYGSVRWLIHRLSETPFSGRYAVIIDGIEKISTAGQNALLKTIEEPNDNTNIILITSSINSILQTIKSRATIIKFPSLPINNVTEILKASHSERKHSELEFAAIASGGSVEHSQFVLENFDDIIETGNNIRKFINSNTVFNSDIQSINKKTSSTDLISILINIYAYNLRTLTLKQAYNVYFEKLYIDSQEAILKLLKILTAVKKTENFNVNISTALKAMLFKFKTGPDKEMPFLERYNI